MIKYKDQYSNVINNIEDEACVSKEATTTDIFFKRLGYLTELADKLKSDTLQKLKYLIIETPVMEREITKPIGESEFFKEASDRLNCIEYLIIDIQSIIDSLDV